MENIRTGVSVRRSHLVGDDRRPVMRQQLVDNAVLLRRQSGQHILQIGVGIVAVQLRRLDQTHHGGSKLATAQ